MSTTLTDSSITQQSGGFAPEGQVTVTADASSNPVLQQFASDVAASDIAFAAFVAATSA